jgi:hypothetical protein
MPRAAVCLIDVLAERVFVAHVYSGSMNGGSLA